MITQIGIIVNRSVTDYSYSPVISTVASVIVFALDEFHSDLTGLNS
jgi:hypothetical protein